MASHHYRHDQTALRSPSGGGYTIPFRRHIPQTFSKNYQQSRRKWQDRRDKAVDTYDTKSGRANFISTRAKLVKRELRFVAMAIIIGLALSYVGAVIVGFF